MSEFLADHFQRILVDEVAMKFGHALLDVAVAEPPPLHMLFNLLFLGQYLSPYRLSYHFRDRKSSQQVNGAPKSDWSSSHAAVEKRYDRPH